jgi:flagellar hook-associated protein 2
VSLGGGALTVSSPTNQVNGLIPGVSLNVLKENQTVSVTVRQDTEATVKAVGEFVAAFNGVKDLIADQTRFDPGTQAAGVLLGNRDVAELANELSAACRPPSPGWAPAPTGCRRSGWRSTTRGS